MTWAVYSGNRLVGFVDAATETEAKMLAQKTFGEIRRLNVHQQISSDD